MVLSGTEQAVAKLEVSVMYVTEYTNFVSHPIIVLIIIVDINMYMECPS